MSQKSKEMDYQVRWDYKARRITKWYSATGKNQIFGVAESPVLNSRGNNFKSSQQSIFTVEYSMAYYLENQTEDVQNKLRYFSL